jgi:hypothetical protein
MKVSTRFVEGYFTNHKALCFMKPVDRDEYILGGFLC